MMSDTPATCHLNDALFRGHRALAFLYGLVFASILWVSVESNGATRMHALGLSAASAFAALCLLHLIAMAGARRGASWGRALSLVIGAVMLIGVPLGTIIGLYLLVKAGRRWEPARA